MKKSYYVLCFFTAIAISFFSCEKDESDPEPEPVEVNEVSIIPSTSLGRPNNYLGCVEIGSRITTIEVWDHGTVDGDIVSIIANGNTIIDAETLSGPGSPILVEYDFGYNGFNYITLFAHNLGDISPNTCTISINGVEFILEANLDANGSIDVVVSGYGVDCSDATGGPGGGGGSGTGDLIFWTNQDLGCGNISVTLEGIGGTTISGYYGSAPDCSSTNAGGNFNDIAPGTYNYSASCTDYTWNGTVTVPEDGCMTFQLTL